MGWHSIVNEHLMEAHRGVIPFNGRLVIFGNDGYDSDPLTRVQVGMVKTWLEENGYTEEEFGTTGYSWAMVVRNPNGYPAAVCAGAAEEALWACFVNAKTEPGSDPAAVSEDLATFVACQRPIAARAILRLLKELVTRRGPWPGQSSLN
jgi:hypothetical protein